MESDKTVGKNTSLILLLICLFSAAAYLIFSDEVRFYLEKLARRSG